MNIMFLDFRIIFIFFKFKDLRKYIGSLVSLINALSKKPVFLSDNSMKLIFKLLFFNSKKP